MAAPGPRSLTRHAPSAVALSSLRPAAGARNRDAGWRMNPDGLRGRCLLLTSQSPVRFPLRLEREVTLESRVALLPHDWRDGVGSVEVTARALDGQSHEIHTSSVRLFAGDRGRPGGRRLTHILSVETRLLELAVSPLAALRPGSVTRALWIEPILDVSFDASARPVQAASAPPCVVTSGVESRPLVSVLVPVHDPPIYMLQEAIASVTAQTFTNWQLCLVDDGSRDPLVTQVLHDAADSDPRISVLRHDSACGISAATNTALQMATGTFIATLDHDDTLTPDALHHVAAHIHDQPGLDMLYSDEDTVDDGGRRLVAHFKPGWSPDTLRTNGYTCHLGVYRRELVQEIGGFRPKFDGSQDVDMILRLIERTDRIGHIPRVLYHWRAHASSTAGGYEAKPYAYVAARAAISEHVRRTALDADVTFAPPGLYRVVHRVDENTSVEVISTIESLDGLRDAVASWMTQSHPNWHLRLAVPTSILAATATTLAGTGLPTDRYTLIELPGPGGDPADALTAAARDATAEHLVLMHDLAIGLTHDWMARLVGYSAQAHIAAAGPVILAPDGRIQHAGIALPDGVPLYLRQGDAAPSAPPVVYNVSAVSGLLATSRSLYTQLGGLHPNHRSLTLIDYCLRANAEYNHRTVLVPDARLRTTGPDTTINDLAAINHLRTQWQRTHDHDPYYNPNYRTDRGDFIMRRYG